MSEVSVPYIACVPYCMVSVILFSFSMLLLGQYTFTHRKTISLPSMQSIRDYT